MGLNNKCEGHYHTVGSQLHRSSQLPRHFFTNTSSPNIGRGVSYTSINPVPLRLHLDAGLVIAGTDILLGGVRRFFFSRPSLLGDVLSAPFFAVGNETTFARELVGGRGGRGKPGFDINAMPRR